MHALHEKAQISFSHFVRWVVAQEPASTHRAWKPYTRSCRFEAVQYASAPTWTNLDKLT
jgi:hypothetical protein